MKQARQPLGIRALLLALLLGLFSLAVQANTGPQSHQAGLTFEGAKALLAPQHRATLQVAELKEDSPTLGECALPLVPVDVLLHDGAARALHPLVRAYCPPARGPPVAAS